MEYLFYAVKKAPASKDAGASVEQPNDVLVDQLQSVVVVCFFPNRFDFVSVVVWQVGCTGSTGTGSLVTVTVRVSTGGGGGGAGWVTTVVDVDVCATAPPALPTTVTIERPAKAAATVVVFTKFISFISSCVSRLVTQSCESRSQIS